VLLAGLVLAGFVALSSGVAEAGNDDPGSEQPDPVAADILPDVVISVPAGETAADDAARIVAELRRSPSIVWVADDQRSAEAPTLVVAFAEDSSAAGRRAVADAIAESELAPRITVSGRDVTDREILDRVGLGVFLAATLAALVMAICVSWMTGLVHGLMSGLTIAVSAWLAGTLGRSAAGTFDGSLVTTSIPAVLTAIVVSGYLVFRLLGWFGDPEGDDPADMIRRSVLDLATELLLLFAGMVVLVVFFELVGPGRSVATVALVGALTSALLTLAVVPAALAALHGSGAVFARGVRSLGELFPIPNGRAFPVAVLAGFACFLVLLGLFSFRPTAQGEQLDERALEEDSAAVAGTRELLSNGGDPTAAVFALFPLGTDQLAKVAWLERVSQLPAVERVDTPGGRYVGGAFSPADGLIGPAEATVDDDEAPRYALVVPGVTSRSRGAIELVDEIRGTSAPVDPVLAGAAVDASLADERDRSQVWLTIVALAIVGGAAVFGLIGDLGTAGLAAALRLVGLAAVAGAYHLLTGSATGAEVQIALFVVSVGMGLFELGYLRRLLSSHRGEDTDSLLDDALVTEGAWAALALGLAAVGALGLLVPDLAITRRFGILLAVVIVIKVVIGMWLLRPAILGTRAIRHFASHPVRVALQALNGASVTSKAEHQAWVEVVSSLLWTEFDFQADPATASIDAVFVPDTPLHRQSVEHHLSLTDAGLRIIGRKPQLRALRVVNNAAPATVVVTVDHPVRQLIDRSDNVVGVRKAERRSVMLWLVIQDDGTYRIIDSVELGAVPLGMIDEPVAVPAVVTASLE